MNQPALPRPIERWPFLVLAAAAVALAAGGAYVNRVKHDEVLAARYAELTSIGQLKVQQIGSWRAEREADARVFSHDSRVADLAATGLALSADSATIGRLTDRLRQIRDDLAYANIYAVAVDGRRWMAAAGDGAPDEDALALAGRAIQTRRVSFGEFDRSLSGGPVHIDVAAPLVTNGGRLVGALVLRSDPASDLYPIIAGWPTPSTTAETLLLRRDGNDILFLNDLRHRREAALTLRVPVSRTSVAGVQAVLGRTGRYVGDDYRGHGVLADIRPVPGSPWFMVAKIDLDEALSDARLWTRAVVSGSLLSFALIATSLAYLTRRRQRNLYRVLYEAERVRIEQARLHAAALAESEERFRTTLYSIGDAVITTDTVGSVRQMNPTAERLTGWTEAEAAGQPIEQVFRIINEETGRAADNPVRRVIDSGSVVGLANHTLLVGRDGIERPIDDSGAPIRATSGETSGVVLVFRDQTSQRRAQARDRWLVSILEQSLNEIYVFDAETLRFEYANRGSLGNLGYTLDELRTMTPLDIKPEITAERFAELIAPLCAHTQARVEFETVHRRKDGTQYDVLIVLQALAGPDRPQLLAMGLDVTTRKRLETDLAQARRMEAIGRLAGGVAHDFNNLLYVINNYADFGIESLPEGDAVRQDLVQIRAAGERAATLTRQLLAFSRRQIVAPEPLDLGQVVTAIEPMLRRLIGENIDLCIHLGAGLWTVHADRGQIEQVLVNLAANARDAMPDGGALTLETANADLDEAYAARHVGAEPGRHVCLVVSDTGVGMDEQTRARAFEPFFTTKGLGHGTGLGLSTVFGIVKQSRGNVWVYSEPGHGTTFKIYLPAVEAAVPATAPRPMDDAPRGSETILLVEDDPTVRSLAAQILDRAGYRVVVAEGGHEALTTPVEATVDLLLTDVVMPRMSGRQLAGQLRTRWPGLKVLYMSGYTDNSIVHHGVLEPGIQFIGKPFSAVDLTRKVRRVLDEP